MSEIRYNVTHPESDNEDKNKKGGRSVISGNRYTASVGTEFVNIAGSKEQLSCRLKRNGCRDGWGFRKISSGLRRGDSSNSRSFC